MCLVRQLRDQSRYTCNSVMRKQCCLTNVASRLSSRRGRDGCKGDLRADGCKGDLGPDGCRGDFSIHRNDGNWHLMSCALQDSQMVDQSSERISAHLIFSFIELPRDAGKEMQQQMRSWRRCRTLHSCGRDQPCLRLWQEIDESVQDALQHAAAGREDRGCAVNAMGHMRYSCILIVHPFQDLVIQWREAPCNEWQALAHGPAPCQVCKPRRAGAVAAQRKGSRKDFEGLFEQWLQAGCVLARNTWVALGWLD